MRRAAKRDSNEPDLLKVAQAYGWTVKKQSEPGRPDWLCMRRGRIVFIEVKDKGGALTPAQEKEFPTFEAAGVPIHVCYTEADVRKALGLPVESQLQPLRRITLAEGYEKGLIPRPRKRS
jgi:hypothetical protein